MLPWNNNHKKTLPSSVPANPESPVSHSLVNGLQSDQDQIIISFYLFPSIECLLCDRCHPRCWNCRTVWQKFSQWDADGQIFLGIILFIFSFRENFAHQIVGSMSLISSSMTSSNTLFLEMPLTLLPLLTASYMYEVLYISEFPCSISNSTLHIPSSLISQGFLFSPSAWRIISLFTLTCLYSFFWISLGMLLLWRSLFRPLRSNFHPLLISWLPNFSLIHLKTEYHHHFGCFYFPF